MQATHQISQPPIHAHLASRLTIELNRFIIPPAFLPTLPCPVPIPGGCKPPPVAFVATAELVLLPIGEIEPPPSAGERYRKSLRSGLVLVSGLAPGVSSPRACVCVCVCVVAESRRSLMCVLFPLRTLGVREPPLLPPPPNSRLKRPVLLASAPWRASPPTLLPVAAEAAVAPVRQLARPSKLGRPSILSLAP